ncbi:MAG: NADPH:quinone oxidoreductase [Gammaproteobacteria bacterium TMED278]|mgnify:FL=1|nr:NADPH:quinone oxidoreductase [Gammaproteobacteria bacterium]OUX41491.1 MAG: NADPH:quinone oxidoreductase [Gammaproteobacteria bacterium TMED278]|tara:strand:+ start:6309 stop:7307 length:999 start_codon:yes stop_codon:yes gene_type:complete
MKALQCTELGGPEKLKVNDVPEPKAIQDHVVIDNKAASVNFPDVLMIQGLYQFQPELPFCPGGESSGIVSAIGEGVENIEIGDRVFAMTGLGAFAEKIVVHKSSVVRIPETMNYETAAALPMTYGTSLYALKQRAELKEGETLLVLGAAGGVGLATVELGKAMGAKVIAAASTQEKIDLCIKHGADEGFIYPSGNLDRDQQKKLSSKIKELTGGIGVNVVYDPIGDAYSEPCIRATAWDGRYLVIGFAAGEIPKIPINLALLKGMKIVGVFWGAWVGMFPEENKQNFQELFELHSQGKINPEVSDSFLLEDGASAIAHLKDRKAKGKVIIKI